MPPVIPDPDRILAFASFDAFYDWLEENHGRWPELWLQIYKKKSGQPTISYEEAVRAALCWGWIDGIKKTHDQSSFLQRFTPRRAKSIWSQVNTRHVAALVEAGLMRPPGLKQIEAAKADGRWDAAYASGSALEIPEDFLAALKANAAATATYETLNRANLYSIMFRVTQPKRPETRARKIAEIVSMLERGETLQPNGRAKKS
ncbi:YdeI/OmpD-associated family protein [Pelagibacterium limicola]|uniref:YdeI/OmpD-associated family protein n=1 Tax=Pelagibacterium limicola TaxID=2791022 RepID=UPI0018AF7605|nr:YdeI/OmpD-associated family protein [Pelagibacterium limicola]